MKMHLTPPSVVPLPMLHVKLLLRFMWFDLTDLDKWDISWSKLLDCGRFTCETLSIMTIHYI